MNLYSDKFDFEKFYNETKDDDMYCIVFNLIEDIECLKEYLEQVELQRDTFKRAYLLEKKIN